MFLKLKNERVFTATCTCRRLDDVNGRDSYSLTVTARDSAVVDRRLSSSLNVTINLSTDRRRLCLPTFERPLYRAHVSADCPVGHQVTHAPLHAHPRNVT